MATTQARSVLQRGMKRGIDILASAIGLMVLSPALILVVLIVRWKLGGPVLFAQQRPGLHGRVFRIYKFRTMTNQRDTDGKLLPDAVRLTGLGRFLRATSIDELPELYNVLRGDMSLVGPRPLMVEYLKSYTPEEARRHDVKPGITGWAQINGRNAICWEDKFRLDVWYVDNWSLFLDFKILLMTAWKVFCREGISAESHATMPWFERPAPADSDSDSDKNDKNRITTAD